MTCLTCGHGQLRDSTDAERDRTLRAMARLGAVNCRLSPHGASFHSLQHRCPKFMAADTKTARTRQAWARAEGHHKENDEQPA